MGRPFKKNQNNHCPDCRLYNDICMCGFSKNFDLDTRITLLMHVKERNRVSNTGKIADWVLENSKIFIKGGKDYSYSSEELLPDGYFNLVLYPAASTEINLNLLEKINKPLNLIALDGNYNQTGRMFRSEPAFRDVLKVRLPLGQSRKCGLRNPAYPEYISTIEAITQSLIIIGESEAASELERVRLEMEFRLKNRAQLQTGNNYDT